MAAQIWNALPCAPTPRWLEYSKSPALGTALHSWGQIPACVLGGPLGTTLLSPPPAWKELATQEGDTTPPSVGSPALLLPGKPTAAALKVKFPRARLPLLRGNWTEGSFQLGTPSPR